MAAVSPLPSSGLNGGPMIDPTRQGEYPVLLGDKLANKLDALDSQFVSVTYNYKSKSGSSQQKAVITSAGSEDRYKLTIQDKAGNAEQTCLKYVYNGSVDPALPQQQSQSDEGHNLVLVFDPERKAFILEPVTTSLNFNLQSAPGKTDRQVAEQYTRLDTLSIDEQAMGKPESGNTSGGLDDGSEDDDIGEADSSNPFDYRHFLPSESQRKATKTTASSKQQHVERKPIATPQTEIRHIEKPKIKEKPKPKRVSKPKPKAKTQSTPLLLPNRKANPTSNERSPRGPAHHLQLPPAPPVVVPDEIVIPSVETPDVVGNRFSSTEDTQSTNQAAASPNSNIIVDGDLIIDLGSPPPQRRPFKMARDYGSSSEDDGSSAYPDNHVNRGDGDDGGDAMDEDQAEVEDDLVAEMEAALAESDDEDSKGINAEQPQHQQRHQHHYQHAVDSDESEVSEEE